MHSSELDIHAEEGRVLSVGGDTPYIIAQWGSETLSRMALKLPGGQWITVLTAQAQHPVLGRCDLVCGPFDDQAEAMSNEAIERPITPFRQVKWSRPKCIPPLAEPGRLPQGGGAAILNAVSITAQIAGLSSLRYTGPYPTEALFDALHTSFALGEEDAIDLVATCARFTEGVEESALTTANKTPAVDWHPRPFMWSWTHPQVCVQRRDEVEAVYVNGQMFSTRGRTRRLVRTEEGFSAEVFLAGEHWATVATLDGVGTLVDGPHSLPEVEGPIVGQPLPASFRNALVRALPPRAPQLMAPALAAILEAIPLEWGDAGADEATMRADRLVVHGALASRLRTRPPGEALEVLARAIEGPARRAAQRQMARVWSRATETLQRGEGQ
ncbi:MAG: hypothetical protein ACE366_16120 [Bradymonadia bacterium]